MPRPDLLASLVALTGDLKPSPETTAVELADLRRAFVQSLASGAVSASGDAAAAPPADLQLLAELTAVCS